jgi:DNA-binding Xre family transcriptional regulator
MTMKHILDGAMQHTKARNHRQLSILMGIDNATLSRISKGDATGMRIGTLDLIQQKTGISADTLLAWYRLPEGASLGRVQEAA